jgi:endonuclease/exonuclease/phosphatase family metal-dependent hydrolase
MSEVSCSVLTLNCEGHKHLDLIIPFLQQHPAEVLCLQEVFAIDLPQIEAALQRKAHFAPLARFTKPNSYEMEVRGEWGVAIFTSLPVVKEHLEYYIGDQEQVLEFLANDANAVHRAVLGLTVEKNQQQLTVFTTHFTWSPDGKPNAAQWKSVEYFHQTMAQFPEYMICGDFNAPRGGEIYQSIVEKLAIKDYVPEEVKTTLDEHIHSVGKLKLVVDYFFATPPYELRNVQTKSGVSDHLALVGELVKKYE